MGAGHERRGGRQRPRPARTRRECHTEPLACVCDVRAAARRPRNLIKGEDVGDADESEDWVTPRRPRHRRGVESVIEFLSLSLPRLLAFVETKVSTPQ